MVTLLMVLFIVMFAMSQVDQKKFNALKAGLAAGFGQSTSMHDGSSSILEQPGTAIAAPVAPDQFAVEVPPRSRPPRSAGGRQARAAARHAAKQAERRRPRSTGSRPVEAAPAALGKHDLAATTSRPRSTTAAWCSAWSRGTWSSSPNVAELCPRGQQIVDDPRPGAARAARTAARSTATPTRCKVKPKYYPTDWELSSARAVTVLRYLNEAGGIPDRPADRGGVRPHQAADRPRASPGRRTSTSASTSSSCPRSRARPARCSRRRRSRNDSPATSQEEHS